MVSFPPCKINLGLHILRKRIDGYHDLETCFYPVPWNDILEIIPSDSLNFTCSGTFIPGREEDNLCLKAYQILKTDYDIPLVKIHLHKVIPTGAGLGGGSADAAYTLRLLNTIFNLKISHETLQKYAALIGSDCSFFLHDNPMLGTGRGEILHPINVSLKGKFLMLLKPTLHISTTEAYAGTKPAAPTQDLREILETTSLSQWKYVLKNDFEESVFKKYPSIARMKEELYNAGALYASMSGSGSTVFAIFENEISHPNVEGIDTFWMKRLNQ